MIPTRLDIVDFRHVGHRAAGFEIRQDNLLIAAGENIGTFGHEVDAAEENELGVGARSGLFRKLPGIAAEIGELDDFVALIVMPENDESIAKFFAQSADFGVALFCRHLEIFTWDALLAKRGYVVPFQQLIGEGAFFRHARTRRQLRIRQECVTRCRLGNQRNLREIDD